MTGTTTELRERVKNDPEPPIQNQFNLKKALLMYFGEIISRNIFGNKMSSHLLKMINLGFETNGINKKTF